MRHIGLLVVALVALALAAPAMAETTPPSVAWTNPKDGQTVTGSLYLTGTASDNVAVSRVEVRTDSNAWVSTTGTTGWSRGPWYASWFSNGRHTLSARAIDTSGNITTATITVNVCNSGCTVPPPPSPSPPPPPPSTGEINVLTQYGTSATAVAQAVTDANAQHRNLYFPAGTYTSSNVKPLVGIKARGDGATSVIQNTDKALMTFRLTGDGAALTNLKTTCPSCPLPSGPPTSARLSTGESTGVFLDHATNATVSGVTVDRAGSAGILAWHSSTLTITNNVVRNTLADAIHTTGCSAYVTVAGNTVTGVGDDFYAVVSYHSDVCQVHDVVIRDNVGDGQPWGRGISVVGGYNVQILRNRVSHTYGAAVYIVGEPQEGPVDNVKVDSNVIRFPDQGHIHGTNILIGWDYYRVSNVYGANNNCDRSRQCIVIDPTNVLNITVTGFYGN